MLPDKPKDKWINAKKFSWFFEYGNEPNISEEDWYFDYHMSLGMIMQTLADQADHNGIEIIHCEECVFCKKLKGKHYCKKLDLRVKPKKDFCSMAERKDNE